MPISKKKSVTQRKENNNSTRKNINEPVKSILKSSESSAAPSKSMVFSESKKVIISEENLAANESNVIITDNQNRKFSRRDISSNWSKYDEPIDSYEESQYENQAADFQTLLQMPASRGGHFQFKNEKIEDFKMDPSNYFDYFRSKPVIVATALSSIPFHIRNNLDQLLFADAEIQDMNERAALGRKRFNSLLQNEEFSTTVSRNDYSQLGSVNALRDLPTQMLALNIQSGQKFAQVKPEPIIVERIERGTDAPNQVVDLDKWLDDFLDS